MAGLSSRFMKAGYSLPKYMLEAKGRTIFEWSMLSFEKYKESEGFIFICRDIFKTPKFIEQSAVKIGINNFEIIVLDKETKGQADTVNIALDSIPNNIPELYIFNIDTLRKNFSFSNTDEDGYLEVFKGKGDHWSFIQASDNNYVSKTSEKNRISNLCSNGLYFFKNKNIYQEAFDEMKRNTTKELYIAPMYNYMINKDLKVKYYEVDISDHVFLGTPDEYLTFLKS